MDFQFLGLDPLAPTMERFDDQSAGGAFCQQLLLLGAKWWESEAGYSIVLDFEQRRAGNWMVDGAFAISKQPPPTMREKRIIKAGWPSTGGVWISEFDTTWAGVDEEENLLEGGELARLRLARTMDERCAMLRDRFRGVFHTI
ncbi:MAG: hypothetical protein Q9194_005988 [Teloschistes cf. exilis]